MLDFAYVSHGLANFSHTNYTFIVAFLACFLQCLKVLRVSRGLQET